jgi:hypothetical protein
MSRTVLTDDLYLYVNQSVGNDANAGDSNASGHALATIYRAIVIAARDHDFAWKNVRIRVYTGDYAENLQMPDYIGGHGQDHYQVVIEGHPDVDPYGVKIKPSTGVTLLSKSTCEWTFRNLWIENSGGVAVEVEVGGKISLDGVRFGAANLHVQSLFTGSVVEFLNNTGGAGGWSIAGDALVHGYAAHNGQIIVQPGAACNIFGTRTIANDTGLGFFWVDQYGMVNIPSLSFSGSGFTGRKFNTNSGGGKIYTNGVDPNSFIPGSINGS